MEKVLNKQSLILDANNLLYRTFFAQIKEAEDVVIGMCHHSALWTMNKYYKQFPADEIVMAFDSHSWRKLYTKNLDECVTYKKYKGTRRQNLTTSEALKLERFDTHVQEFADIMRNETSILVLQGKYLEADDLIAGYIQENPDTNHVLISSDKDYIQLLGKNKLNIIDPDSGKPRSLDSWDGDPDYFMFEKCIRGDTSDNVMSAYPRLQTKKIKLAYNDEYLKENVMNHTFVVPINLDNGEINERTFNTRDVFDENKLLMDLELQPQYIRNRIKASINDSINTKGKFNYIKFLKFCKKHELKNILDKADQFVPMLAGKKY